MADNEPVTPPTGIAAALKDVEDFHRTFGHPVYSEPHWPDHRRIKLRLDLIDSEVDELHEAVGDGLDFPEIGQELVDIIYVVLGMAHEFGIPLDRVWDEVHRANMRKVDPVTGKVRYREDGKVLKPEGWVGPDLREAVYG